MKKKRKSPIPPAPGNISRLRSGSDSPPPCRIDPFWPPEATVGGRKHTTSIPAFILKGNARLKFIDINNLNSSAVQQDR
jgi:hypothetical protein